MAKEHEEWCWCNPKHEAYEISNLGDCSCDDPPLRLILKELKEINVRLHQLLQRP